MPPFVTECLGDSNTIGTLAKYVISGGRAGYDRLQVLSRVRWPETAKLLELVGVTPGMRCLDLGCGGGDVTLELARMVAPDGAATGVDMDEVKIGFAREAARKRGLTNVDFVVANVTDWGADETYDLVYCRFLLEHVRDPLDLLRRMWSAVRVGGAMAVEATDFEGVFCDPPNDGFAVWQHISRAVLEKNGGDPRMGRKLHRYFREAGGSDPRMRLTQDVNTSGEAKVLPQITLEAMADAIAASGLATERELAAALESLTAFTADPRTLVAGPHVFQVWAHRA